MLISTVQPTLLCKIYVTNVTFLLNLFVIYLSYMTMVTSLYKPHHAFILVNSKLCGSLEKAPRPTTWPRPTGWKQLSSEKKVIEAKESEGKRMCYFSPNSKADCDLWQQDFQRVQPTCYTQNSSFTTSQKNKLLSAHTVLKFYITPSNFKQTQYIMFQFSTCRFSHCVANDFIPNVSVWNCRYSAKLSTVFNMNLAIR